MKSKAESSARAPAEVFVFANGQVITCDPSRPQADWCVIEGDTVREVGSGTPPPLPRIDLAGRTLIPGFCDAHVHLTWLALSFLGPDLKDTVSRDDVVDRVRAWTGPGRGPEGAWIVADGFDESTWQEKQLPTRADLDRAVRDRPVLVKRVCGHVGALNSAALTVLGASGHGPLTDADTGRIAETDLWALNDRLRPASAQLGAALPQVFALLLAHGITAVHDVAALELLPVLESLRRDHALPVRISYSIPAAHLDEALSRTPSRDAWLRYLGLKVFVDGSLGAHTACLRHPYADQPDTHGTLLYEPAALDTLLQRGHDAGLQLMVHAIGDAALDRALDALEPLCAGDNPLRHRLEHVEVTPPDIRRRLARSDVRVCLQPNFAARWSVRGGMNEQRLGDRIGECNAYASLLAAGVTAAFGSDCMPLGPLYGLSGAVHHPQRDQRIAPEVALDLYTRAAAELVFAESIHGQIRPGLAADLAVLSADPTTGDPSQLHVDATFVAGRRVFARPGAAVDWGPAAC